MKTPTLTQSENLKIGQRGPYIVKPGSVCDRRCKNLGIVTWVEKRRAPVTEADRNLRQFIDIPTGYNLVYGITYKGQDFDCGDMPRDISAVTRGVEFANKVALDVIRAALSEK